MLPLIDRDKRVSAARRASMLATRPFESPELDLRDEIFRRGRRLHAVVLVEQVPQRLIDAERAGDMPCSACTCIRWQEASS